MSNLITISHLSGLIQDQSRILGFLEDHPEARPTYDPIFPDNCVSEHEIGGEPWSLTAGNRGLECTHRQAGRTVLLSDDQQSAFDFHPRTLLRYVSSIEPAAELTDIVVDNWVLANYRLGRLVPSPHGRGYYTFS